MNFLKKTLSVIVIFAQVRANAIELKCFEDEGNPKARIISLYSADSGPRVITFAQTFGELHPQENWGYSFRLLKQSESSGHRFPLGVYSGFTSIYNNGKELDYRGTLVIEEAGQWSFSGYEYEYKGTYLLHGSEDMASGLDKSVMIPVNCRGKGLAP